MKEAFGRMEFNVGGSVWDLWSPATSLSSSGRESSELLRGRQPASLPYNEPQLEMTEKTEGGHS